MFCLLSWNSVRNQASNPKVRFWGDTETSHPPHNTYPCPLCGGFKCCFKFVFFWVCLEAKYQKANAKTRKLVSTSEEQGILNLTPSPTEKLSENDIINKQSHWLMRLVHGPYHWLHPSEPLNKGGVTG